MVFACKGHVVGLCAHGQECGVCFEPKESGSQDILDLSRWDVREFRESFEGVLIRRFGRVIGMFGQLIFVPRGYFGNFDPW